MRQTAIKVGGIYFGGMKHYGSIRAVTAIEEGDGEGLVTIVRYTVTSGYEKGKNGAMALTGFAKWAQKIVNGIGASDDSAPMNRTGEHHAN